MFRALDLEHCPEAVPVKGSAPAFLGIGDKEAVLAGDTDMEARKPGEDLGSCRGLRIETRR